MKKTVFALALCAVFVGCLSGCSRSKSVDAVILNGNASGIFLEEFLEENRTYGAYCGDGYCYDEECPRSRCIVIKNREEHEKVFTEDAGIDVDYDEKMLVIYTFTSINARPIEIVNFSIESGHLFAELKVKEAQPGIMDASRPYQRYVIMECGKAEITDATVERQ